MGTSSDNYEYAYKLIQLQYLHFSLFKNSTCVAVIYVSVNVHIQCRKGCGFQFRLSALLRLVENEKTVQTQYRRHKMWRHKMWRLNRIYSVFMGRSIENTIKLKSRTETPKTRNKLIQIRMGKSIGHIYYNLTQPIKSPS